MRKPSAQVPKTLHSYVAQCVRVHFAYVKPRPNDSNISAQHIPTLLAQHLQTPAKRSQHLNATDPNIVGHNMLRACGHPVVTCCDMLRVENRASAHAQAQHCCTNLAILVPRGRAPFSQHQESRPLAVSNNGSPRFTDFPSLCACSESNLTNLIGSGLNLLCLQIHSKPECRWTGPEVAILGADQKERGLWGRECFRTSICICEQLFSSRTYFV